MKKISNWFLTIIVFLIFVCFSSVTVYANAPVPADYLTVYVSDSPDNAVYADLLIKIDENDSNYVDFQPNRYTRDPLVAKEIVDYSKDGYRSFTFHYKDSKANIRLIKTDYNKTKVNFCAGSEYQAYLTQYEDLCKNYRSVKVALLDKDFNIITVSNETQLPEKDNLVVFLGDLHYNVADNSFYADNYINFYFIVFYILFSIVFMLFSIGTELLVAVFFGFKGKKIVTILVVNACTQVMMRILYILLPFAYLLETIILEILIYTAEILIYKKLFKDVKIKKIIAYTVIANTLSLIFGILLDCYVIPR